MRPAPKSESVGQSARDGDACKGCGWDLEPSEFFELPRCCCNPECQRTNTNDTHGFSPLAE